jgi:hypothetical protein
MLTFSDVGKTDGPKRRRRISRPDSGLVTIPTRSSGRDFIGGIRGINADRSKRTKESKGGKSKANRDGNRCAIEGLSSGAQDRLNIGDGGSNVLTRDERTAKPGYPFGKSHQQLRCLFRPWIRENDGLSAAQEAVLPFDNRSTSANASANVAYRIIRQPPAAGPALVSWMAIIAKRPVPASQQKAPSSQLGQRSRQFGQTSEGR